MHGDLCKHLGIHSSTDHPDRYSNLFLNAYINRHVHAKYLKMVWFYSPLGIWHVYLYSINTNIGLWSTGNTRKYHQIDVYIYQCGYFPGKWRKSSQELWVKYEAILKEWNNLLFHLLAVRLFCTCVCWLCRRVVGVFGQIPTKQKKGLRLF